MEENAPTFIDDEEITKPMVCLHPECQLGFCRRELSLGLMTISPSATFVWYRRTTIRIKTAKDLLNKKFVRIFQATAADMRILNADEALRR